MKTIELDITQWQDLMIEAAGVLKREANAPLAVRCENNQLSVGWKAGGFTMNGHFYTAFNPLIDPDNRAMLAVREDFLRWVTKRLKEIDEVHKAELEAKQPKQGELGL